MFTWKLNFVLCLYFVFNVPLAAYCFWTRRGPFLYMYNYKIESYIWLSALLILNGATVFSCEE